MLYDSQNALTGAASFTLGTTHEVGVIIPVSQMGTLGVQRQVARPGCGHAAAAEVGEAHVQPGVWPACRTVPPVPPTPRAREFLSRVLCLWNEHTALTRGVNSALRDAGQCPLRPGLTHAPAALCRFGSVTRDCPVLKQRELHVSPGRLSFGCTWRTLGDSANLRTGF